MEISFNTFTPRANSTAKKLSLEKDEQARICFIENAPRLVFVHNFEKLVVGDDGQPIKVSDTWPDGTPRESLKTEYAGKLRCLGDDEVVNTTGVDPENCPACAASITNSGAIKPPTTRILGRIVKYNVKANSFSVAKPFSAQLLVWDLTAKRFSDLKAIYDEHGNLAERDLLLGPCENKGFQKFNIAVAGGDAARLESDDTRTYIATLLEEAGDMDIESVAGKLPSKFEMDAKVSEVVRAYNHATGSGNGSGNYQSLLGADNSSVSASGDKPAEAPQKPVEAPEKPAEVVPESPTSPAEKVSQGDVTINLDDLLKM